MERASHEQPADMADAAWRNDRKGHDQRKRGRRDDSHLAAHVRSTAPREDCERDEGQRIELRGRADAQGYKAERTVPAQQSEEREQHQSCRPKVVALDNERRVERERQGRGHEHSSGLRSTRQWRRRVQTPS